MISFTVNKDKCIKCEKCIEDCPVDAISIQNSFPAITEEKEDSCIKCQHCFAICPTGAISICGKTPENSFPTNNSQKISPLEFEKLIKGKRSIRKYKDCNMDETEIRDLLTTALHAPTGVNAQKVRFTVISDKTKMKDFRARILSRIDELITKESIDEKFGFFTGIVRKWKEDKKDIIFRDAPHMILASAPENCPTPKEDCIIALSYFDLLAATKGIGTVWCGMAKWAINDLAPEFKKELNIPDNHIVGYVMMFGIPDVKYFRTVQREPVDIKFYE